MANNAQGRIYAHQVDVLTGPGAIGRLYIDGAEFPYEMALGEIRGETNSNGGATVYIPLLCNTFNIASTDAMPIPLAKHEGVIEELRTVDGEVVSRRPQVDPRIAWAGPGRPE